MLTSALVLVLSATASQSFALEVADIAPIPTRVPQEGAIDVPVNAALLSTEGFTRAVLVTIDPIEGTEVLQELSVSLVEGLTVVEMPVQPQNALVRVRLGFSVSSDADLIETSWTTGARLIEEAARPATIASAVVEQPPFENPRAVIELARDEARGAAVLFTVDGDVRTAIALQVAAFGSELVFVDFGYAGGRQDYEVVSIDQAGEVADATSTSVEGGARFFGCSSSSSSTPPSAAALAALLFAALRLVRRRR